MNVQEQMLQLKRQRDKDKNQDKHRYFNTLLILVLVLLFALGGFVFKEYQDKVQADFATQEARLLAKQVRRNELAQIVKDEGYKRCRYKDTRAFDTIGFGHLILPEEDYKCISPQEAVDLLLYDYRKAEQSVTLRYPWAQDEAYLVLVNMTYQMGATGVSKFRKTLACLEQQRYQCAAGELLDSAYASQTPSRAARLAGRILAIGERAAPQSGQ